MKKGIFIFAFAAVLLPLISASAATWQIDPVHSSVGFSVKHMTISTVHGEFTDFSGQVEFDPSDLSAGSVEVTVQAESISTDNKTRDNHLRSADFFEVKKYPTISFVSRRIEKGNDGNFKLIGDLSMHGVTHEVQLDAEGTGKPVEFMGKTMTGFHAEGKVNRGDFGLTWNKALDKGGFVVGENVAITIDIELVRKP